jgi:hypothetical protein
MAYQIAFDLEEIATQDFLSKVASNLPVQEDVSKDEWKGTLDFDLSLSFFLCRSMIHSKRLPRSYLVKNLSACTLNSFTVTTILI